MKRLLSTALAVSIFATMNVSPALAFEVTGPTANALPTGGSFTNAEFIDDGSTSGKMDIQINGGTNGVGVMNWDTYNVGSNASVNYTFTAHSQTALNKVSATGGLSKVYGNITNSSCAGCGYEATGKVILINPNGVVFGDTANVNLNSFTVTTFDKNVSHEYDAENGKWVFKAEKNGDVASEGIHVFGGAQIKGNKGVNMMSDNITTYTGSKISTQTALNYSSTGTGDFDTAFGKVKLITADGVNFSYYTNGAINDIVDPEKSASTDTMHIILNGEIEAGNIDIRNMSTATDSKINIVGADATNKAILKAVSASQGNDGTIWLISGNDVVIGSNVEITTDGTQKVIQTFNDDGTIKNTYNTGDVTISAMNKNSFAFIPEISGEAPVINSIGDIKFESANKDVSIANNAILNANKNINIMAGDIASVHSGANIQANNIFMKAGNKSQIANATATANKNIEMSSKNTEIIKNSSLNAENVTLNATDLTAVDYGSSSNKVTIDNSIVNANGDININSYGGATIQNNSRLTANNMNIGTTYHTETNNANLIATNNIDIGAQTVKLTNTNINAGNTFSANAIGGTVVADRKIILNNANLSANNIELNAQVDITGSANLNNSKTYITAGKNIELNLANVGNRENGLVAEAGNNMTITTDGALSVSSLISGNDMTLNASEILSGNAKTTNNLKTDGDSSDRAYIQVGGTFKSTPNFTVTDSADITADKQWQQRHHIQYGADGAEKILLVNKRPYTAPIIPPIPEPDPIDPVSPDSTQASMLNRLPQQPQTISNVNNISDTRTTFIDVFAAASQIEIDEEE